MKYIVVIFSYRDQQQPARGVPWPSTYSIPYGRYRETTRQFLDSNFIKTSWAYLGPLSIYLLTCPLFPHSMSNISWWYSLPVPEVRAILGAVPMGLGSTLDHYVSQPITFYPPSHPVIPYPNMSPSPHRLLRYPPPTLKSYNPAPPSLLFIRTLGPSPIFLSCTLILTTPVIF